MELSTYDWFEHRISRKARVNGCHLIRICFEHNYIASKGICGLMICDDSCGG